MDQEHVEERFKEHLMNAAQEMMMRQFEATAAALAVRDHYEAGRE